MRKVLDVIWGVRKQKYFCKEDSTQNCPTGKSPRRREHIPLVSRTRCSALRAAPQSRDPQQSERHDGPRIAAAHPAASDARCAASGERPEPAGQNKAPATAKRENSLR